MPPQIATLVFAVGAAGLFWLNRDGSVRVSKSLWLPVIWVAINGSRSLSVWFGMAPPMEVAGQLPQTSMLDQLVAATLMLSGATVLIRRRTGVVPLLKASWPIVLYFSFCLVSLLASDFPAWGFKRWVRALGDVIMALIVVTDPQPAAALRRLFSSLGFVLLPASVLLIKYYPDLGRVFSPFGDAVFNTGVTTNKNSLGVLVFVISLGTLWQLLELLRHKEQLHRTRRLLAQGTLFYFGISLLFTAHSATSGAAFALGAGLMLAITLPVFRARPAAVHVLVVALLLAVGAMELLDLKAEALQAMGRNPDLTGRTDIWRLVTPMVPSAIVGAGFETFWCGPRVAQFYSMHGGMAMTNEAHNGYVEVYLNLGWVGMGLIAVILVHGYLRAVSAFRHDSGIGALLVAYVASVAAYNIGEAGFRMLNPALFFLLLSVVAASRAISLGNLGRRRAGNSASIARQTEAPLVQADLTRELWTAIPR